MSKISVKKEVKSSPHSGGHTSEKPELAKPPVFSWIPCLQSIVLQPAL